MSGKASEFLDCVLRLRPAIAVFDCDGTLWAVDAGERFLSWEIRAGLLPQPVGTWVRRRYDDYLAGKVGEEAMCGEMVTVHAGLEVATIAAATERFFAEQVEPKIFPVMRELVRSLLEQGSKVWAVSSTNQWLIETAMRRFGIPTDHILAAAVEVNHGVATDRLLQVPTGAGKAEAIQTHIGRAVDAAFGNSIWDREMLAMARQPFVINPNPDLRQLAEQKGWPVYLPEAQVSGATVSS